ncbi:N-acetylmuramoyl-L-alanine amidase [Lysinibacillus mangiferihumi]|uniref:Autolysin n=1 Tax=Lysinibacillus mangiferihumi TaxID=1130819 RepID=A0A4U2Y120_9BACI|nr:N-acetylmuramoyl-L-alanine amidase [Lysinibacillus mangiferihumi]TKI53555.1 N-acetylmuramoyl-L-alanine amidase [Lysinibacillus mangiferihumi]
MTYVIEQRIMSGLPNYSLTTVKYVIAHESGNAKNNGPNALENELAFMNRNKANAFTSHWVGDGGKIVQVAPVNKLQYGCGPKGNPLSYAQVELARTADKEQFKKDYAAYIWLLRKLAKDAGIPIVLDGSGNGIKSHRWITNNLGGTTHVDPYAYLASMGITEAQFKRDIQNGLNEEGLTVDQYNELKKEIKTLQGLIAEKANLQSESEVASSHKEAWEWAIKEGIIKGDGKSMNPTGALTRQQMATMLKRYHDKFNK